MKITGLDHVVLTVRDMKRTIAFYQRVLGFEHVVFDGGYDALHFGNQKINLHPYRKEYEPHAAATMPGTGDLCFISNSEIGAVIKRLAEIQVAIELGPVPQTGARGAMMSVYFRDPDENLVEVASYAKS